jgi:uncharacterized protein with NRDE domain
MCTVTFVPTPSGFVLTSNRDETKYRPTLPPSIYVVNGKPLLFPKDKQAGGTWIATDKKTKTVCLLNGAFENHIKNPPYRKSRGLILLDSFAFDTFTEFAEKVDLENIEPFTLLLIEHQKKIAFLELRWDGQQKHIKNMDVSKCHIWSSATLYNKETQQQRRDWFNLLLKKHPTPAKELLFNFHHTKQSGEKQNDMIMKRANGLETISISQVVVENLEVTFTYDDLTNEDLNRIQRLTITE